MLWCVVLSDHMCFCGLCVAGVRKSHLHTHQCSLVVRPLEPLCVCVCREVLYIFISSWLIELVHGKNQNFSSKYVKSGNLVFKVKLKHLLPPCATTLLLI